MLETFFCADKYYIYICILLLLRLYEDTISCIFNGFLALLLLKLPDRRIFVRIFSGSPM